ncbi:MAG TPA: pirin family protein [Candidatus Nanoarchaeia archaeon]|nr:pirin family protein [Candidatus Nanoarchaeia archaeon]
MNTIHRSADRGQTKLDWLESRHSFSFGDYQNPKRINCGTLCVLNEDWIEPASGFPRHPHRNMEIITIILSGFLEHKDSMGNKRVITTGEVQHMSAGTGIVHAEYNPSKKEKTHLLQIWIEPKLRNIPPEYCQKKFLLEKNKLQILVSGTRNTDSLFMQQDAIITRGFFDEESSYIPEKKRNIFLFVITGKVKVNEVEIGEGDSIETDEMIKIIPQKEVDFLLIEV